MCNKFPVGWTFSSSNVFDRLNVYLNRLNDIRQIFITAIEFAKLERIEIGGLKGRCLSRKICEVRVQDSAKTFQIIPNIYNCISISNFTHCLTLYCIIFETSLYKNIFNKNENYIYRSTSHFKSYTSNGHLFNSIHSTLIRCVKVSQKSVSNSQSRQKSLSEHLQRIFSKHSTTAAAQSTALRYITTIQIAEKKKLVIVHNSIHYYAKP